MNPEQAGQFLFQILTSVPDGDVQITVSRSSLLSACSIRVLKRAMGPYVRGEQTDLYCSDDFADALDKVHDHTPVNT